MAVPTIVQIVLGVIVLSAVFYGLYMLYASLSGKNVTTEQKDFQNVIASVSSVLGKSLKQQDVRVAVPVSSKRLSLVVYPANAGSAPVDCHGNSCICLYETVGEKSLPTCKEFPNISEKCEGVCGSACFAQVKNIVISSHQLTVSRACHEVSLYDSG